MSWRLLNHRCKALIFKEKLNAVFALIPPLVPHNYLGSPSHALGSSRAHKASLPLRPRNGLVERAKDRFAAVMNIRS